MENLTKHIQYYLDHYSDNHFSQVLFEDMKHSVHWVSVDNTAFLNLIALFERYYKEYDSLYWALDCSNSFYHLMAFNGI